MTEFPEIKRAQETPTFLEDGEYNGDPIYEVENIKEERRSRAVWARAIADFICPLIPFDCSKCWLKRYNLDNCDDDLNERVTACLTARELLAQAGADEK